MKSAWNRFWASKASWFLLAAALLFNDREYFFPLSSHADLRFQAIGEGLEGIVLAGIYIATFFAKKKMEPLNFASPTIQLRIAVGLTFAAFLLTLFWRDFFPGDHFSLSTGSIDFVYAPIAGLVIGSLPWTTARSRPSGEHEEPVV